MPMYDCGAPDCEECQRAFKDRTRAIENYHRREQEYAKLEKPMPVDPSPPCRVCASKHDVICYPLENRALTICPDCCAKCAEHPDGETGHVFEYDRGERDHVCQHCGVNRAQTDYQPEPMEGDVPLFGLIEPGEPLGTPISEISTTPGKKGYENWLRISQSWGH